MPQVSATASFEAVRFAMKATDIFVMSSLFAALGAYLALQQMAWVFCLALALVFYLAALVLGTGLRGALALVLSFLVFYCTAANRLSGLAPGPADLSRLRANVVCFCGRVQSCKIKESDQGEMITAVVAPGRLILPWSKNLDGKVLVHVGPYKKDAKCQGMISWGGNYVFTGRLIQPRAKVFTFEFDEQRWLRLQGIFCQVSCKGEDVQTFNSVQRQESVAILDPSLALLERWAAAMFKSAEFVRDGIVALHIRVLGEDRGKLLTSMVLGDRAVSLSDETKNTFNRVGLSHLLAASGLNLTIIVGACVYFFSLRKGSKRSAPAGWMETLGSLACVLFFVSLAGASPSVTRATIMCLILLWSGLLFRRLARGAALAGALWLALLFDPLSILDVGLELSYGATFGIIYFYPIFIDALPYALAKKPWHWLCAICAVVVAAQLAVLPVQIYFFQKISTLVLPANILAEPLVAPITVLGFVSSFIAALAIACDSMVSGLWSGFCCFSILSQLLVWISTVIDYLSGFLIDLLFCLTRSLGAIPFSSVYLARPESPVVVFYFLILLIAFLRGLLRPAQGAILAVLAGAALTFYSFLFSSCLEVLVTPDQVVLSRPLEMPIILDLPAVSSCRRGSGGYLPAFHRDFALSFIRSLKSTSVTRQRLDTTGEYKVIWSEGALKLLPGAPRECDRNVVSLLLKDDTLVLASPVDHSAIEIEEAQSVRLYKFKIWGLLAILVQSSANQNRIIWRR